MTFLKRTQVLLDLLVVSLIFSANFLCMVKAELSSWVGKEVDLLVNDFIAL